MTTGTKILDHTYTVTVDSGTATAGSYVSKTWSGDNDPKKHKKANAYLMQYWESRDGVITYINPNQPGVVHTDTWVRAFGGVSFDPAISWSSNDDLKLVNKLGDRIRNHEFNAAVSVGAEGREALEQIAHAASSIYSGMRNLKRGNVQGALKNFGLNPRHIKKVGLHKDLSGKVLATQLGWIPLMSDIKDAFGAVKSLTETPKSMTYHATHRIEGIGHVLGDSEAIMGKHIISKKLTWTLSENFTIWESLSLSNPWDFADGVWNATRLSFVADWFIPIGSYLSARSLAHTLKGSGYLSTFDDAYGRGVNKRLNYVVHGGEVYFQRQLTVKRTPLSTIDGLVALPRIKDFNKIPSWRRALTSVALATQMFL